MFWIGFTIASLYFWIGLALTILEFREFGNRWRVREEASIIVVWVAFWPIMYFARLVMRISNL